MIRFQRSTAVAAILLALTATAHAQSRDPFDSKAPVVRTPYRSTFADYQRYQDPDIAPWKAANEEVGQMAGHTGHGGQADGNAATPSDPHAGHADQRSPAVSPSKTPPVTPDHGGMHKP